MHYGGVQTLSVGAGSLPGVPAPQAFQPDMGGSWRSVGCLMYAMLDDVREKPALYRHQQSPSDAPATRDFECTRTPLRPPPPARGAAPYRIEDFNAISHV